MRLDRQTNKGGCGKYAVVKLRGAKSFEEAKGVVKVPADRMVFGTEDRDSMFFVIFLKDKYAARALEAYALAASEDDKEYAADVMALAHNARSHPHSRRPD